MTDHPEHLAFLADVPDWTGPLALVAVVAIAATLLGRTARAYLADWRASQRQPDPSWERRVWPCQVPRCPHGATSHIGGTALCDQHYMEIRDRETGPIR